MRFTSAKETGKVWSMTIEKFERVSDGFSLDQVRVFLAVVDAGSFSGAARKLKRAQSAITYAVQKLEEQFDINVFDRTAYRPVLTPAGQALVPRARRIAREVGAFRAQAKGLAVGVEAEVSLTVDGMFPMDRLLEVMRQFKEAWPQVSPRVMVENLGAAAERVLNGSSSVGILSSVVCEAPAFERRIAAQVRLLHVVAPHHPLATFKSEVPLAAIHEHVQLVLTDRSQMLSGHDFGVVSTQTWRLSDLGAKHAMLLAGFGWGGMPEHLVAADLAEGRLVRIFPPGVEDAKTLTMYMVHRVDAALGPAARWLADRVAATEELLQRGCMGDRLLAPAEI